MKILFRSYGDSPGVILRCTFKTSLLVSVADVSFGYSAIHLKSASIVTLAIMSADNADNAQFCADRNQSIDQRHLRADTPRHVHRSQEAATHNHLPTESYSRRLAAAASRICSLVNST